ncbi:hypothetical protein RJ641_023407 [Dillenia turbinata]|uniref:Uncharacterized protein n=1 Tax=Dillenia turbinata TaxID=194707 RepID=A0AAN8UEF4_9MAGN
MGCFLNCLGDSRRKTCRKSKKTTICSNQKKEDCKAVQISLSKVQQIVEEPINPISESNDAHEKKSDFNIKKKVTFDLNVKTYDVYSSQEDAKILVEKNEEKGRENTEQDQKESKSLSDSITISYPENHRYRGCLGGDVDGEFFDSEENDLDDKEGETEELKTGETRETKVVIEESSESLFSLSIESRTKAGADTLDDREVNSPIPEQNLVSLDSKSNGSIQISGDGTRNQFVHDGSLISLSVESRTNDCGDEPDDREVNCRIQKQNLIEMNLKSNGSIQVSRDGNRNQTVADVLNPVENLIRWKSVKETANPPPKLQNVMSLEKENINTDKEYAIPFSVVEPSFKTKCGQQKSNKEIGVDTSLSSWLVESENDTPMSKLSATSVGSSPNEMENSLKPSPMSMNSSFSVGNSKSSYEDRPILGALTVEELKQISKSASPRRSPSKSPDDIPIIGTVGSYWSHTGQNMDSCSGSSSKGMYKRNDKKEGRRGNWQSTPFQTRLERAVNRGTA